VPGDVSALSTATGASGAALDPIWPDHVVKLRNRCGGFRSLRSVTSTERCLPSPWNGSWKDAPDNPSAASAVNAMSRAIVAASTYGARDRTSCKRLADAKFTP
jgi:hypothetical protein